ncbi:rhodanese-like domain-containing protein [Virgibacillus halophilus]|uniref:Rhodanese-like domain-containing protein n=1 Tax=Tigheibacillus halophilus TaxID=361280 RepID=A0ABU5C7F9_9BACI|nr:rhodanese-like domain-containing protein [Virgibacillus halophilus]
MSYLISVTRLKRRELENTVIVDVRFDLQDDEAGRKAYINGHIPNAVYLDLNQDLSAKKRKARRQSSFAGYEFAGCKIGQNRYRPRYDGCYL